MNAPLRLALVGVLVAFFTLFVITTFLPTPAAEYQTARLYFTEAEIEIGLQYSFERRLLFWASTGVDLGLLLTLVATGAARRIADAFAHWTGYCPGSPGEPAASRWQALRRGTTDLVRWLATLLLVGLAYLVLHELLQFPISLARHYHSRAWGMTQQPLADWLGQHFLAAAVMAVGEGVAGVGLYVLLRYFPRTWYVVGTVGATLLAFATVYLMPVLIAPLFNTFTPLSQSEWARLEPMVRQLTEKAGIHVEEVYVVDASRQGSHTNAYFTGLGSTQSIVLYDTLLKKHPPAEVESILAHEIGHWVHHHVVNGILLGSLAALAGLIVLDRVLRYFLGRPPLVLANRADPAGLPLVMLLCFLGSWVAMPLENLVSRHFERQADAMSLQLADMPDVFIEAEKRLARDNLGNVVPAPWNVWLFATHPPAVERIEMAERWKQMHGP
jgi:STE24 endopeptidase